jgi:hypothetical protein
VAKRSYNTTSAGEAKAHYAALRQADSVIYRLKLLNIHPDPPSGQTETWSGANCIRCSSLLVS